MKLTDIGVSESSRGIRIAGVATWDDRRRRPETVEFVYQGVAIGEVGAPGDVLAAALLLPAMGGGEDLEVDAPVSAELLRGMSQVAAIWSVWRKRWRRSVVHAEPVDRSNLQPVESAACFSGGVDSFFTLLRPRPEPITTMITLAGGLAPGSARSADETVASTARVANVVGKRHVVVESNALDFGRPLIAVQHHGAVLAATALGLAPSVATLYIPASWSDARKRPWGSHPDVDHLWSTELLHVIHDAAEFERHEKVRAIADCGIVCDELRVCNEGPAGQTNCGRCGKCLSTMLALHIVGKLDDVRTFGPLSAHALRRVILRPSAVEDFEMLRAELDDRELKSAISWALRLASARTVLSPARSWVRHVIARTRGA